MRKEPGFIYRVFLVVGDAFAIVASFTFAYYFRLHFDHRPYVFAGNTMSFLFSNLLLLPIWLIVLSSLGLYSRKVLQRHGMMAWRLLLASIVGTMSIITYDFFATAISPRDGLFPVKVIALYATIVCFFALSAERVAIALLFRLLHRRKYGLIRTVVAGDGENVRQLLLGTAPESGYKICGVVAESKYIPQEWNRRRYPSLEDAIKRLRPDAVVYAQGRSKRVAAHGSFHVGHDVEHTGRALGVVAGAGVGDDFHLLDGAGGIVLEYERRVGRHHLVGLAVHIDFETGGTVYLDVVLAVHGYHGHLAQHLEQ